MLHLVLGGSLGPSKCLTFRLGPRQTGIDALANALSLKLAYSPNDMKEQTPAGGARIYGVFVHVQVYTEFLKMVGDADQVPE